MHRPCMVTMDDSCCIAQLLAGQHAGASIPMHAWYPMHAFTPMHAGAPIPCDSKGGPPQSARASVQLSYLPKDIYYHAANCCIPQKGHGYEPKGKGGKGGGSIKLPAHVELDDQIDIVGGEEQGNCHQATRVRCRARVREPTDRLTEERPCIRYTAHSTQPPSFPPNPRDTPNPSAGPRRHHGTRRVESSKNKKNNHSTCLKLAFASLYLPSPTLASPSRRCPLTHFSSALSRATGNEKYK